VAGAALALYAAVLAMTGPALREVDQATYLDGALHLASGDAPFTDPGFFDYDKQYGSYWLLAAALRCCRGHSPILIGNLLQVLAFGLALLGISWRLCRGRAPLLPLLPVWLSPAVAFSFPFFGTSAFSAAFLLLAWALRQRRQRWAAEAAACVLVAIAATCRADAVLAVPALILADSARRRFWALVRSPRALGLAAAAVLPPLFGKAITAGGTANLAPFVFKPQIWAGFIAFGLGPSALLLLFGLAVAMLATPLRKRRWFFFYAAIAGSLLLPLAFYLPMLHTPRFFLLTLAGLLFIGASRRTAPIIAAISAWQRVPIWQVAFVLMACVPWFVGISAVSPRNITPVLRDATEFPSSKGHQPMGAYLAYIYHTRQTDFVLDHNQEIWLAARSTDFAPCRGEVPILDTPMASYLRLAADLQGKEVRVVKEPSAAPCGYVYVEARALTRATADDARALSEGVIHDTMEIASPGGSYGQPILRVEAQQAPSDVADLLLALRSHFGGTEIAVHIGHQAAGEHRIALVARAPFDYALVATPEAACRLVSPPQTMTREAASVLLYAWSGPEPPARIEAALDCARPAIIGWAQTTLPQYMSQIRQRVKNN
jgi:hypothetical protein